MVSTIGKVLNDENYGKVPEVECNDMSQHRVFSEEMARPPQMWSTHPANRDREDNAKKTYIPADIDERDPQHLRHDARKAVEELSSKGVLTYCLTLDANADTYVKRIFGANNYTIMDHVDRLPEQLPTLFASLTS